MPDIAAPAGWYFVRVWHGPGHVNGLARYPVVSGGLTTDKAEATALVIKPQRGVAGGPDRRRQPGRGGLLPARPRVADLLPGEEVRAAMARWKTGAGPAPGQATVAEVEMPGVGQDARCGTPGPVPAGVDRRLDREGVGGHIPAAPAGWHPLHLAPADRRNP